MLKKILARGADRLADRLIDGITKVLEAINDTRTPTPIAPKPEPSLSEQKAIRDVHRSMYTRNGHYIG